MNKKLPIACIVGERKEKETVIDQYRENNQEGEKQTHTNNPQGPTSPKEKHIYNVIPQYYPRTSDHICIIF